MTVPGRRPRRLPRRAERGIALVLVLWVVALLTIMAMGLTATQRTETALAGNQVTAARFRAESDAALEYVVLNLLATPALLQDGGGLGPEEESDLLVPDGSPRTWRFAGQELEIRLFDEAALIDLNQAPPELLSGLLAALGAPPELAQPLVDAIIDWRDTDDLHQLEGAEDADYEAEGRPYGAKDGPFDSVAELGQVLGYDRVLLASLVPVLSVDAGTPRVKPDFAPPLVRAALEGLTLEEVEARIEEEEAQEEVLSNLEGGVRPLNRGGPLYRVRIGRREEGRVTRGMEALVRLEAGRTPPYRVLWRYYGLAPAQSAGAQSEDGIQAR